MESARNVENRRRVEYPLGVRNAKKEISIDPGRDLEFGDPGSRRVLRDCYEDGNAVAPTDWTDGGDLVSPRAGMHDGCF